MVLRAAEREMILILSSGRMSHSSFYFSEHVSDNITTVVDVLELPMTLSSRDTCISPAESEA